jgi:hypothetical protein
MMGSEAWSTSPVKTCSIASKRGNVFSRFEDLRKRLCTELPKRDVILDGEVVAIDDEGWVSFWESNETQRVFSLCRSISYKVNNPTYTQAEGRRELFEQPQR